MDSLTVAVDTTRAAVVAISETLRTTVAVADTVRNTITAGEGQGVPQDWTIIAGGALAYVSQRVRAYSNLPGLVADGVIIAAGLTLYVVGFDGQIQWSRGFFVGAVIWLASVRGIGAWLANSNLAPRSNTR